MELIRRGRGTPDMHQYVQQAAGQSSGGGFANPQSFIRPAGDSPSFVGTSFRFADPQPADDPMPPEAATPPQPRPTLYATRDMQPPPLNRQPVETARQPAQGDPMLQAAFEQSQANQTGSVAVDSPFNAAPLNAGPTGGGMLELGQDLRSTPTIAPVTPSPGNMGMQQFVEQISQEYGLRGQQITPEEAIGIARDRASRNDFQDRRPIEVQAQEASARLQERAMGGDPYGGDVNAVLRDQLTVEFRNAGRTEAELAARADQLGLVGTSFLGFMNALTAGGTQAVAGAIDPESANFTAAAQARQAQLAQEGMVNVLPGGGMTEAGEAAPYIAGGAQVASEFAGMAPSVGAAAVQGGRLGTRAMQGLQRVRPGAMPTGGQRIAQAAGGAVPGAFVAGELAQAPVSAGMASAAGASLGEAVEQGVDFATTYPRLAGKLSTGEPLDQQDVTDLLLLIPEALGSVPEVRAALQDVRTGRVHQMPPTARQRLLDELDQRIEGFDVEADGAAAAADAMRPAAGERVQVDRLPPAEPTGQPRTVQPPTPPREQPAAEQPAYRGEFQDLQAGVPIRTGDRTLPGRQEARADEPEPATPQDVEQFRGRQAAERTPQERPEPEVAAGAAEQREFVPRAQMNRVVRRLRSRTQAVSDEARTDAGTQMTNKRGFREATERVFQRADADQQPTALVTFDMTNLKALNDFRGHEVADQALEIVARAMESSLRLAPDRARGRSEADLDAIGVAGRTGGDEFSAVLKNVTPEQAELVTRRVTEAVDRALAEQGLSQVDVGAGEMRTVSLVGGVAHREPGGAGMDDLMRIADERAIANKEEFKRQRNESAARLSPEEVAARQAEARADAEQGRLFDRPEEEAPAAAEAPRTAPARATQRFKDDVAAGEDPPLTYRAMYQRYGVGYATARKVFQQLIDEGVVERQGRGHRLTERQARDADETNERRVETQERDQDVQPEQRGEQRDQPTQPRVRAQRRDPEPTGETRQPRDAPDTRRAAQVDTDVSAQEFMAAYRPLMGNEAERQAYLMSLSTENLQKLARSKQIRGRPMFGGVVRGELDRRQGKSEGGPSKIDAEGSPLIPPTPRSARSAVRGKGRALSRADSPHRIIADLNRELGLGPVGVGRSLSLRTYGGFYRVAPEAIRLRMADALDTHIHEIGHHIHKLVFQGGLTDRSANSRSGLAKSVFPADLEPELERLGRNLYGTRRPTTSYEAEGWAELVRLTFTDPDAAKSIAPQSHAFLVDNLARHHPREYAQLKEFRDRYQLYRDGSPLVRAMGYVRRQRPRSRSDMNLWSRSMSMLFDRTHPVTVMMRDLGLQPEGDRAVRADMNPKVQALRALGRGSGDTRRMIRYGRWDPKNPTQVVGKSLEATLAPVRKHIVEFETYGMLKRALERRAAGDEGVLAGLSKKEIEDAIDELESIDGMSEAWSGFQEFNNWLIKDYAVGRGLLSAESADRIIAKNLHYITFHKVEQIDDPNAATRQGRGGKAFTGAGSAVGRFAKFEGNQIEPPLASFMANMEAIANRAAMNDVGLSIVDMFHQDPNRTAAVGRGDELPRGVEGIGRWIDKVDRPMTAFRAKASEVADDIRQRMRAIGMQPDDADQALYLDMVHIIGDDDFTFFRPGLATDKAAKTFVVLRDGVPEMWQAKSTSLFDFLEGLYNPASFGAFARMMMIPRSVYRAGATTLNPAFFAFNALRDIVTAMVISEGGSTINPASDAIARARGMAKAFTSKDPVSDLFLSSGASLSGLFGEYVSPQTKQFNPDSIWGRPNVITGALRRGQPLTALVEVGKLPFAGLADLNDRFEMATRLGEFEVQLRRGRAAQARRIFNREFGEQLTASELRAADNQYDVPRIQHAGQAAADITLDFQRGGTLSVQANQFIPFFNAAMQGGYRLARAFRQNPAGTIAKTISMVVVPSMSLMLMNRDNEAYWKIPVTLRDRYWYIPITDYDGDGAQEFIRLPKPYGLGAFSLMAERAYASLFGRDPISGKYTGDDEAFRDVGPAILDQFRPPYTVPIITPMFELLVNHSLYMGRPIVYTAEQTGDVQERGAERSSHFSVAMSEMMVEALGEDNAMSPIQMDYLINGVFAGLGTQAVDYMIDPLLAVGTDMDERARIRQPTSITAPETWPILERLIVEEPRSYTENMVRYHNHWKQADEKYRGLRRHINYSTGRADDYFQRNEAEIMAYYQLRPFKDAMDTLWKQLRFETLREGLDAEERWRLTTRIYREMNDIAAEAVRALETADDASDP